MPSGRRFLLFLTALIAVIELLSSISLSANYDPLAVSSQATLVPSDVVVKDEDRDRQIPLRVYLPRESAAAPVVLFSHGLGGSREGSSFLGRHWAGRGYVVVFLQHLGSDSAVWRDVPVAQRMARMREAAGAENFLLRAKDVPAVLDQLERWNDADGHELAGRLDLERIGMSGHSFGAVTTQAVSGQTFALGAATATDARIKAAIALSPSSPRQGDVRRAFGSVKIPWLLMTGTKDVSRIGGADVDSRLGVFPALPAGRKYELVLDEAEHSAFSDRALPGDREPRNPNHHQAILAISTAFWDAYLRDDAAAREWLDGDGPPSLLEKNDRWQKK